MITGFANTFYHSRRKISVRITKMVYGNSKLVLQKCLAAIDFIFDLLRR